MQGVADRREVGTEDVVETVRQVGIDGEVAIGKPRAPELHAPVAAAQVIVEIVGSLLSLLIDDLLAGRNTRTEVTIGDISRELTVEADGVKRSGTHLPPLVDAVVDSHRDGEERRCVLDVDESGPVTADTVALTDNLSVVVLHVGIDFHRFVLELQTDGRTPPAVGAPPFGDLSLE